MSAAEGLGRGLGHAEMPDLALGDEVLDRARDILDRHAGIDAVLVEQVDGVDPQPLQRALAGGADAFGPARHALVAPGIRIDVEAELGRDHHLVANRPQRLADQLLIGERPVDFSGVEEGHPALTGRRGAADRRPASRGWP